MAKKIVINETEKSIDCIMLFKKNIIPEWEDPSNAEGGSLIV